MRYAEHHKGETRRHIIDVAAKRFRKEGVAAAGIAAVMADAGLTNGAFYTHFDSKDDLVREALLAALGSRVEKSRADVASGVGLDVTIRRYLSTRHRDDSESGCATAALVAEIARLPHATRETFTSSVTQTIDLIARRMPAGSAKNRRRDAVALYAMMVGTLQLARATSDASLSDEILASGRSAALEMVRQPAH